MKRNASPIDKPAKAKKILIPSIPWTNSLLHGSLNSGILLNNPLAPQGYRRDYQDLNPVTTVKSLYREMMDLRICALGEVNPSARLEHLEPGATDWPEELAQEIEDKIINKKIMYIDIIVAQTHRFMDPDRDWMFERKCHEKIRGVFFGFGDNTVYYEQPSSLLSKSLFFIMRSKEFIKISNSAGSIFRQCWRGLLCGYEAQGLLSLGEISDNNREGLPLYRDDFQSLGLCLTGAEVQPFCGTEKWRDSTRFYRCNAEYEDSEEPVKAAWKHGQSAKCDDKYRRQRILQREEGVFTSYLLNLINVMRASFLVQIDRKLGEAGRKIDHVELGRLGYELRSPQALKYQMAMRMRRRYTPLGLQPVESVFFYPKYLEKEKEISIDLRRGTDRTLDDIDESLLQSEVEGFIEGYLNNYSGRIDLNSVEISYDREDKEAIANERGVDEDEWL